MSGGTSHPARPRQVRVFISHSSADADLARTLQDELERPFLHMVECFNASGRDSLDPGSPWIEEIVRNLREADVLVAVLTPPGLRSAWVNFEAGAVWLRGDALVVPCCAGQTRKSSLPPPYSFLQALELDAAEDVRRLFERLAALCGVDCPDVDFAAVAARLAEAVQLTTQSELSDVGTDRNALGNRIERYLEIEWWYRRSSLNRRRWAARYHQTVEFEVTDPAVPFTIHDFTPAVQAVGFSAESPPVVSLVAKKRSSSGEVRVAEPHQRTGSKFAFRIYFEPALRRGDTVRMEVAVDFPEYRLGVREDLVVELMRAGSEVRDHDFNSRTIVRPNDEFVYRVVLPKDLGATPLDPVVTRNSNVFPDEQAFVRTQPGVFAVTEAATPDGDAWVMELRRKNPPFRANYRVQWRLPLEREVAALRT